MAQALEVGEVIRSTIPLRYHVVYVSRRLSTLHTVRGDGKELSPDPLPGRTIAPLCAGPALLFGSSLVLSTAGTTLS